MTINEVKGDLFEQVGYEKVFALDATFKCDVGICKKLDEAYGVEKILKSLPEETTKWKGKGYCVDFKSGTEDLHALVVKALPTQIPEYEHIHQAISCLATNIRNSGSIIQRKLAFPHICCGSFDKRDWDKVKGFIEAEFNDVDCEILFIEN